MNLVNARIPGVNSGRSRILLDVLLVHCMNAVMILLFFHVVMVSVPLMRLNLLRMLLELMVVALELIFL